MEQVGIAILGAGWIGGTRARILATQPTVSPLVICDLDAGKAEELARACRGTWTSQPEEALARKDVAGVVISTRPEGTHYPLAMRALEQGKHVLLEKPMALQLSEADNLIETARRAGVKLTIGYTQRFNTRLAYAKQEISKGTLGDVVTAIISRNETASAGERLTKEIPLSLTAMVATHDIDSLYWCLAGKEPVQVYAQAAFNPARKAKDVSEAVWMIITMDDGAVCTIGANWLIPPNYREFGSVFIEFIGTEGAITIDETRRDLILRTGEGVLFPLSAMPGEPVGHVYHGPMKEETLHFLGCLLSDVEPLVRMEEARKVMETTVAADLSAARGKPVRLPLSNAEASS